MKLLTLGQSLKIDDKVVSTCNCLKFNNLRSNLTSRYVSYSLTPDSSLHSIRLKSTHKKALTFQIVHGRKNFSHLSTQMDLNMAELFLQIVFKVASQGHPQIWWYIIHKRTRQHYQNGYAFNNTVHMISLILTKFVMISSYIEMY